MHEIKKIESKWFPTVLVGSILYLNNQIVLEINLKLNWF